jgi:hypothetical protein
MRDVLMLLKRLLLSVTFVTLFGSVLCLSVQ